MLTVFSAKESVVEKSLARVLKTVTDNEQFFSIYHADGDSLALKQCYETQKPSVLLVNTIGYGTDSLTDMFSGGEEPVPKALLFFGSRASEIGPHISALKKFHSALGESVLYLTSLLSLWQMSPHEIPMSSKFSVPPKMPTNFHDLKDLLFVALRYNDESLKVQCENVLRVLKAFVETKRSDGKQRVNLKDGDVKSRFLKSFHDFLVDVLHNPPADENEEAVIQRVQRYCTILGGDANQDMENMLGAFYEGAASGSARSGATRTESVEKIPVTVLVVEDEPDYFHELKERYDLYPNQAERYAITFLEHIPQGERRKRESKENFRQRLLDSIQDKGDERLKYLQVVIMDYAMTNLSPSEGELITGVSLAREIKKLRPGVDIFLLTGKDDVLQIVEEGDGIFARSFIKKDLRRQEFRELYAALVEHLERKYCAPFWNALQEFARRPVITLHAMAMARGKSAKTSGILSDFLDFYKDNYFMAETSATVEPLDSLLHPTGSIKQAQERAAHAFGAKPGRTLFVTNGTSTANKIVLQAILRPGDAVLVDRNCHISHHYGITLARAKPYYLMPDDLPIYGISGGVPLKVIQAELTKFIKNFKDVPRAILLTNCTFDGIICKPRAIIETVRKILVKQQLPPEKLRDIVFLFDEAWFAYARFHPRYVESTGMATAAQLCIAAVPTAKAEEEAEFFRQNLRVYVTHSTHKTLSAFRQASMIHIWDPVLEADEETQLRLEEAFLTHTSTSPHSGIIASLDIARRQAELEGCAILSDALKLAEDFRKDFQRSHFDPTASESWKRVGRYFNVLEEDALIPKELKEEFVLDPTKITLHIKQGFAGANLKKLLLTKYGIQINKHSNNTVLMMINAGATESSMASLKGVLMELAKEIEDRTRPVKPKAPAPGKQPLGVPAFSGFEDESDGKSHEEHNIAAYFHNETRRNIDWKPFKECNGLVSATFVTPYPPGYPILVPGQKIDEDSIKYLEGLSTTEIHGTRKDPEQGFKLLVFMPRDEIVGDNQSGEQSHNSTETLSAEPNTA